MANIPEPLGRHVTLEVECLDRLYLNGYIAKMATSGGFEDSCWDPTEAGRFRNVFGARRSEKQARRAQFTENKRQLAAEENIGGAGKWAR